MITAVDLLMGRIKELQARLDAPTCYENAELSKAMVVELSDQANALAAIFKEMARGYDQMSRTFTVTYPKT